MLSRTLMLGLTLVFSGCYAKDIGSNVLINGNSQCKFDYGEIDFCSDKYKKIYKSGFQSKANFDKVKILLDIQSDGTLVVLDPKTKNVFPLYGQYLDIKENKKIIKKREIIYGLNDNKICIKGYKYAYRDLVENGEYCYIFTGSGFEDFTSNKKIGVDILSQNLLQVKPVKLPLNSGNIIEKSNSIESSKVSAALFGYISNHGGKIVNNSSIIRLPDFNNKKVFITQHDESSEVSTYFINVFDGEVGHSKLLGTGVFYEIDNKYNIKVKSFNGNQVKLTYFKIGKSGSILSSESSFN